MLSSIVLTATLAAGAVRADSAADCAAGGEGAIAACTALIDADANDGAALRHRGKAYAAKGDYAKALADYTEAIAVDPTDAKAYLGRGEAYLGSGDKDKALADLQQAVTLEPEFAEAKAALDKARAEPSVATQSSSSAETSPAPESSASTASTTADEPEPQTSVADENSALTTLRSDKKDDSSSSLSLDAPSAKPKSSDMAVFVPELKEDKEPSSDFLPPSWPVNAVPPKNYADETTDWGVNQQTVLKKDVGKKTPISLPGARRVTTQELVEMGPKGILIDVLDDTDHHITLPGAVHIPGGGDYGGGKFTDKLQKKLAKVLADLSGDNLDKQLVFFCYGAECWESYNAALRAINMGYHDVVWYRGGLQSWKDAELPLAPPASVYPMR